MNLIKRIIAVLLIFLSSPVVNIFVFAETVISEETPYEFFRFTTHPDRYIPGGITEVKYFVWHDTGNFHAGARNNAMNFQNNGVDVDSEATSAKIFVDDREVYQMMEWTDVEFAIGESTTDISNYNSISMEVAIGHGVDLHRAVANGIHFFRKVIKPLYPDIQVVRHYDAYSENGSPKNCPQLINGEVSWWTWDRVKELCLNDDPIPFIDYNPVDEENEKFIINKDDYGYYGSDGKWYLKAVYPKKSMSNLREVVDGKIVELSTKTKISINNENKIDIANNTESLDNVENKPKVVSVDSESKKGVLNSLFNIFGLGNEDSKGEIKDKKNSTKKIESIKINGYKSIDWTPIKDYILKDNPEFEKINGISLDAHLSNYNDACKIEDINPWTIVWEIKMTNSFKFTGIVKSFQNNYGGLRTKSGDFLSFTNNEQGNLAFVQYLKKLTGEKIIFTQFKNLSLDSIPEGEVKTLREFGETLGFEEEFLHGVMTLYKDLKK